MNETTALPAGRAAAAKLAVLGLAGAAALAMALASPQPAMASSNTQTDATTTSVSARYSLSDFSNPQVTYAEISEDGRTWSRASTTVLTNSAVTVTGLKPGTEYDVRIHLTAGSVELTDTLWDLRTVPSKVSSIKVGNTYSYSGSMWLTFSNPGGFDGYEISIDAYSGKKADKTIRKDYGFTYSSSGATIDTDSTKMSLKTAYKAKMRTYVLMGDGKTKKWSEWSSTNILVPQPAMSSKIKKAGSGVKVSWSKVSGAKSYTVYASANKDKGYKKVGTVKGNSKVITKVAGKKMRNGKGYYVYAVANVPYNGKTYKSPARYTLGFYKH